MNHFTIILQKWYGINFIILVHSNIARVSINKVPLHNDLYCSKFNAKLFTKQVT